MKPCPHKHVMPRIWSRHWHHWIALGPDARIHPDAIICRDCKAWLAVGESDETQSAVEIRAAEIAAMTPAERRRPWCMGGCTMDEYAGLDDAGHLARCIATHEGES